MHRPKRLNFKRPFIPICQAMACILIAAPTCADDYFDRITMASNGRLTRFGGDCIMVYADSASLATNQTEAYTAALIRALHLWEEATDGHPQFRFAPAPVAADIRIHWAQQLSREGMYENIGEAALIRKADGFHVEIEIALRDQATLKPLPLETVESALLHEIGHAVGLWGHSDDPNDVMYFAATAKAPTARDIATWRRVCQTPVDAPFHEQALRALHAEIEKQHPTVAENRHLLGMVYADRGDYQLAIEAFQRALALEPMFRASAVQLGQIFQAKGMYRQAIQHYTLALRTNPSPDVLGALGTLSLLEEKFEQAVDYFEQALRRAPESATLSQNLLAAYHRWGFQLLKAKRLAAAIQCLNDGLARFPFSEILLYDLGVAYESTAEYQKALSFYQRALEISPEYTPPRTGTASVLNNLGAQHANNRDWEQAVGYYQRALEYDPNCQQAFENLEATLMRIGWEKSDREDLDGAILTYQKLLELTPENPQAHNNLGVIYFKKRNYEKAADRFKTALALDANYHEARTNLHYVQRRHTRDATKRALGPVALVLALSFLMMKINARRSGGRRRRK
jgi:tetratricopeptide (TPR) repeat protein